MRSRPGLLTGLVLAALAVAGGFLAAARDRDDLAAAAVLGLGAPACLALARAVRGVLPLAGRSPIDGPPPLAPPAVRPGALAELERAMPSGRGRAGRPVVVALREVASLRLARARGVSAWRDPDAARAVLGEEAWRLVLEPAASSAGPRMGRDEVRAVVETLERL
jgi:hypothetical protein